MFKELLAVLRGRGADDDLSRPFLEMLNRSGERVRAAGARLHHAEASSTGLEEFQRLDVQINKLQRRIRKRVLVYLTGRANAPDLPYCLQLMSLVKDVERIGDYAKDIANLERFAPPAVQPGEDPLGDRLLELREHVEALILESPTIFEAGDQRRALELIRGSRSVEDRGRELLERLAEQPLDPLRHAGRILAHALNVLSSLVAPLNRLDYYDEKYLLAELRSAPTSR